MHNSETKKRIFSLQNASVPLNKEKSTLSSCIHFSNFSFRYGTNENTPFVLKKITLSISYGEVVLIGGISGSGKSTLCNAISGRIPYSITGQMSGSIHIFGKDIWDHFPEDLSKRIGVIFQNAEEQLVTFTVYDELAFVLENLKLEEDEIRNRVEKIADSLGISSLLDRPILHLSGGEMQKVVIAAVLVMSPEILILDEPLAFLDKKGEMMLYSILKKIHKDNPKLTIIIVEHRLNPFSDLLDKVLILDSKGTLVFYDNLKKYQSWIGMQESRYLRDDSFLLKTNKLQYSLTQTPILPIITQTPIMEINNITYSYYREKISAQNYVFHNFSLRIYPGEFLGIVGDNGSGKTTLLYLLAHILEPNEGEILYNGISLNAYDIEEFIPNIGFIFQNPENQIFEMKIDEEILYAPRNFKLFDKKNKKSNNSRLANINEKEILSNLLPLIGEYRNDLKSLENRNPFNLSWGQKRRLNLASIFSYSPEILLIDEPFIGQDASAVQQIFHILKEFHQEGKTIVIVSHDRKLLETNCTRILNLDELKKDSKFKKEYKKESYNQIPKKIKISKEKQNHSKTRKIKRIEHFLYQQDQYTPSNNWLHRLNPVAKIIALIFFTGFLFTSKSILVLIFSYIAILILAKTGDISTVRLLRQIRWIFILTIIYIPLNTLFSADFTSDDQILFYFFTPNLPVRRLAFYYSLRTGIIILILISTGVIFTKTSTPKDIIFSLIQIGIPYRFVFAFMIGMRYIPLIEKESNTIEIAQTLRGFGIKKGSSIKKIYRHIIQQISTLLISILRKTKITAMTIESRGFGAFPYRTNLHHVKWDWHEWFFLIISIFGLTILFILFNGLSSLKIEIPSLFSIFEIIF
ncbi:ATP-binding cassette domain-containing protein [Candidatus Harpocratesius sp.]